MRSRSAATRIGASSGPGPAVDRRPIRGQVLAHPGQWAIEVVAAELGGQVRMAHAEAEDEPAAGGLGERRGAHPVAWAS
jgi:hypothetical protein